MLRRRAGFASRMALEVAHECLGERRDVPTLFCSRHGEVARAVDLLSDLALGEAISPTSFGLAVHNASAGLFSIARGDNTQHIALAAGGCTVEQGVIEACGLLAEGAPQVLLVVYDCPLPDVLTDFEDCAEQPYAWAWLMTPADGQDVIRLGWNACDGEPFAAADTQPAGLRILHFQLGRHASFDHVAGSRCWRWRRYA